MKARPALQRWLPWVALPLLAVPALWPYTRGFPFTADGMLHVLRIVLLDWHVRHGLLFPRWVPELVLGYGYPVFNFYGPGTFYLAEGLRLLGLSELTALMGTLGLLVVFGGGGMYLLARDVFGEPAGPWPALVSAVAYMYAPYLLTNVFIRAAIGEVGAQALLPWIFWSFRRLALDARPARYWLAAALSLGALACTHNITLIFLPPALLLYLAALWVQGGRAPRRLAWLAAGGLAAVGVSAFFWLPLIVERQYLAATAYGVARQFLAENAWTWRNFLDTGLAFEYTFAIPFQLGLAQLGLGLAGFFLARRRDAEWLTLFALGLAACLGIGAWAVPLWLSSDILLVAQFPWRLLVLASLPLALFTGGSVLAFRAASTRRPVLLPLAGAALLAVIVLANRPTFLPDGEIPVDTTRIGLAAIAQFESESSGLGTSSAPNSNPKAAGSAPARRRSLCRAGLSKWTWMPPRAG
jgi:uncharacterized membrane protein